MRSARLSALLLGSVLASGCLVVSLHPVYDDRFIVFDPVLIGSWQEVDGETTVTFERAEWRSYHVTVRSSRELARLSGRLTTVGNLTLLDVTPVDGVDVDPMLLPVHGIYRLTRESPDALALADLDYEQLFGLARLLPAPDGLVVDSRRNVVVTHPTRALRAWIEAAEPTGRLFGEPTAFERK